jgi:hypothetical protein
LIPQRFDPEIRLCRETDKEMVKPVPPLDLDASSTPVGGADEESDPELAALARQDARGAAGADRNDDSDDDDDDDDDVHARSRPVDGADRSMEEHFLLSDMLKKK